MPLFYFPFLFNFYAASLGSKGTPNVYLVALVFSDAALKMLTTACTSISWLEDVNI